MSSAEVEYLSIGGNRQSAAADWSTKSGNVAFGAHHNVAIWQPLHEDRKGISTLLRGHEDRVTAVKFLSIKRIDEQVLVSGSADGEIRIWRQATATEKWQPSASFKAHEGAIHALTVLEDSTIFASGGVDSTVKLWRVQPEHIAFLHTINLKPRYIPMTLVMRPFTSENCSDDLFLAAAGTRNTVQIFALSRLDTEPQHELQATLSGHEGWIRSLSLRGTHEGFLLASASHDKYVRIWRFEGIEAAARVSNSNPVDKTATSSKMLTRKAETIRGGGVVYTITFEALLLGHEDWVYSVAWSPITEQSRLLTASADGSLSIWESDPSSGIWISTSRLGEISGQKGATTATGSAGGFWTGLWSPDAQAVTCLGRTGSWRLWQYDASSTYWSPKVGISGHTEPVNGLSWSTGGEYILSTGSDQTTRLHAEWRRGQKRTWHEFARPQIHGYDLNCVTSITPQSFVSGADEKLLRVFDEPKMTSKMLKRLCGITEMNGKDLPNAANMPVLGLSNKATDDGQAAGTNTDGEAEAEFGFPDGGTILLDGEEPPAEDLLARHTLWPEHEKLYGHGYEISEAVSYHGGNILATACKATSSDQAVIRLYDSSDWHELNPPLAAHSLTVTRLAFSLSPDAYLLSVGRDRQWTVFKQDEVKPKNWPIFQFFPRAHSRMILDAAWSPVGGFTFFATAGRDKSVKLWHLDKADPQAQFALVNTLNRPAAVTAVHFTCNRNEDLACLAVGEEDGRISIHVFYLLDRLKLIKAFEIENDFCPTKAITRLAWRSDAFKYTGDGLGNTLAVAATDGSVRILRIRWEKSCMMSNTEVDTTMASNAN